MTCGIVGLHGFVFDVKEECLSEVSLNNVSGVRFVCHYTFGWAYLQSAHACAVETHFVSIPSTAFIEIRNFSYEKHKKWNECQPKWKQDLVGESRGSLTGPLACAVFQQETAARAQIGAIDIRARLFYRNVALAPFS